MKRIIIILILSAFIHPLSAQNLLDSKKAEILIKDADTLLHAKKYLETFYALVKAKEETHKLIELLFYNSLPEKIENWVLQNSQTASSTTALASVGVQNEVNVSFKYLLKKKTNQTSNVDSIENTIPPAMAAMMEPSLTITFSQNTFLISSVKSKLEKNDNTSLQENTTETMTSIKNYSAITRYNFQIKQGEILLICGGTVVQVSGNKIENNEILLKLSESIDYNKVIEILDTQ